MTSQRNFSAKETHRVPLNLEKQQPLNLALRIARLFGKTYSNIKNHLPTSIKFHTNTVLYYMENEVRVGSVEAEE